MNRTAPASSAPPSRGGISVAEVIIAATMLSVLSVMGITVVCLLMTAEQRAAEAVVVERTIADLADELRRDAHAAADGRVDTPATLVLLNSDGARVTYECAGDGVWRREQRGDETVRQEKFHLPFGNSRFETAEDGGVIVWLHEREIPVTMSLAEPSAATDQPRRAFRIEAALNWRSKDAGTDVVTSFDELD